MSSLTTKRAIAYAFKDLLKEINSIKIITDDEFKEKIKSILKSSDLNVINTLLNDLDKNLNLNYNNLHVLIFGMLCYMHFSMHLAPNHLYILNIFPTNYVMLYFFVRQAFFHCLWHLLILLLNYTLIATFQLSLVKKIPFG